MKKWIIRQWRKLLGQCKRCGALEIMIYERGMGMYDPEQCIGSYCPKCSKQDNDFLVLYDLFEKGMK